LAAAIGRRHWPICWCCLDRGPGSFDVEDATTLSWSSAAVSEWGVVQTLRPLSLATGLLTLHLQARSRFAIAVKLGVLLGTMVYSA